MRPSVALFLARKGLRESLLSTGLMVVAVAVGVGFEVPSTANIGGYRAELLSQSLDDGFGDVRVRAERGSFLRDADAMARRLARIPGVTEVDAVVGAPASVRAHGRVVSLSVLGDEPRASFHPYRLATGALLRDGDEGVLLGVSVAERLGVAIGDEVEVTVLLSTYPRLILDDAGYETYKLTVRGLVGFGGSDSAYVTRSFLARELGNETIASALILHAVDHERAPTIAATVGGAERGVRPRAWMDDSPYLRSSVRAAETLAGASSLMGVLAVGIPVLALLYISTLHRRRQIGLLTAMGWSRADLFVTFLLQALILGAAGVLVGGVIAVSLVRYLVAHPIFNWQGFVVRPVLSAADLARTAGAILATAVVAGTYPAWRAARLDPSRILRSIE
jgi:ABC-type lipoprotein release transport system permease subunit